MPPDETPPNAPADTPPAPPAPSPLAAATAALRASAVNPPPAAPPPATPPAATPPAPPAEVAATPPAATPPASETPAPPPAETPAPTGETPPASEAPPPAPAAGETPPTETPAPTDINPALVARIPGRFPNEAATVVAFEDERIAQGVRQLWNGYMRGEEAKAVMARAKEAESGARRLRIEFLADPVAAIATNLGAEERAIIARNLLADPEVRAQIVADLALLSSPEGVERLADRAMRQRYEYREAKRGEVAQLEVRERMVTTASEQLDTLATQLAPVYAPEQIAQIEGDFLRDIDDWEHRTGRPVSSAKELREALAPRARLLNLSLDPRATGPGPSAAAQRPPARPAPNGTASPASPVTAAVKAEAIRQTAALASTGHKAPDVTSASPLVPPKGASIAEATAHLRKVAAASSAPPS